ncbi:GTP pyrophosphokinase, partial [Streptomyces albogriseolus]
MPDEAQHLTAAKPEPASAPAAKPAPDTPQAKNDTRGPVQRAQGAPVDKPEQPRPKPSPPERSASLARPNTGQPRSGSSNRVRARLARLGVQRANPYNPVLEPLGRLGGPHPPKNAQPPLRPLENAVHV